MENGEADKEEEDDDEEEVTVVLENSLRFFVNVFVGSLVLTVGGFFFSFLNILLFSYK